MFRVCQIILGQFRDAPHTFLSEPRGQELILFTSLIFLILDLIVLIFFLISPICSFQLVLSSPPVALAMTKGWRD